MLDGRNTLFYRIWEKTARAEEKEDRRSAGRKETHRSDDVDATILLSQTKPNAIEFVVYHSYVDLFPSVSYIHACMYIPRQRGPWILILLKINTYNN